MAPDNEKVSAYLAPNTVPPDETFPPPTLPTAFADGILNFVHGPGIAKFYLYRLDASLRSDGTSRVQPVAQVVMQLAGFVQAAAFFTAAMENLVEKQVIPAADWQSALKSQKESFKFNA